MPFIQVKVSCEITAGQEIELKKHFGEAIKFVPGKSEEYLLLVFEDHYPQLSEVNHKLDFLL